MAGYIAVPMVDEENDASQHPANPCSLSTFSFDEKPVYRDTSRLRKLLAWVKEHAASALPLYCRPIKASGAGRAHSTAYLDALRGYASVFVYLNHVYPSTDPTNWRFLPFMSIITNGRGMVALFFVISGYALGFNLLLSMYKQDESRLLNSLASSTFRRWTRLYGSTAIAILIAFVLLRLKIYDGMWNRGIYIDSFFEQLWDVIRDIWYISNPFANVHDLDIGVESKYLPQTWSIPVEYRGSVALFAFCTAFSKVQPKVRMFFAWLVIVACFFWQTVYVANFMFGLFIADLAIYRKPQLFTPAPVLPASSQDPIMPRRQSIRSKAIHVVILVIGLYLLGQPWGHEQLLFLSAPWPYLKALPRWL